MQKCKEIFFKSDQYTTNIHTHTHTHTTHNTHTHTYIRKIAISDIIRTTCHIIYTRFISIHSCKTDSQKLSVKREVLHAKLKKTSRGPFYQARVIIDSEINYNSDPLKIDFNFRSIISLRFMKRLILDRKLKFISINYKVIIDFEKLKLILKSYN